MEQVKHADWLVEAKKRFGDDAMDWKFVCPSCGHIARIQDWKDAGAPEGAVAFACLGRYIGDPAVAADKAFKRAGGPCNYTGGGLFGLNPISVEMENGTERRTFAFAEATP